MKTEQLERAKELQGEIKIARDLVSSTDRFLKHLNSDAGQVTGDLVNININIQYSKSEHPTISGNAVDKTDLMNFLELQKIKYNRVIEKCQTEFDNL